MYAFIDSAMLGSLSLRFFAVYSRNASRTTSVFVFPSRDAMRRISASRSSSWAAPGPVVGASAAIVWIASRWHTASAPDADTWLSVLWGKNPENNLARFRLPAFDQLYEQARRMPDSPERTKLYQEMTRLVVAYVPWRVNTHRIRTDLWYPQVVGYRRHPILTYNFWKYIDIDLGNPQLIARNR